MSIDGQENIMELMFIPQELDQASYSCSKYEKEYQNLKDDLEILKETAKDFLDAIKTRFEETLKEKTPESKLERLARASEEWKTFRKGYYSAIKAAGIASVKYSSSKRHWDTIQSGLAFKREELKKIGFGPQK